MTPRRSSRDGVLVADLQRLLASIDAAGRAILPQTDDALLQSIVSAAAKIFGAAAASILLVNEERQALEFKVAYGAADHNLVGMSFPLGQGIAGYVAMTGQPIAISDVQQDARFNESFARQTGYVPRSILAMPLISGERVIGVMEVLDKIDAPFFGMQDMDLLAMFAQQAAIAIDQSQHMERIGETVVLGLKRLAAGGMQGASPLADALAQMRTIGEDMPARDVLALADLLNQLSTLGEAERKASLQMLRVLADYAQTRSESAFF